MQKKACLEDSVGSLAATCSKPCYSYRNIGVFKLPGRTRNGPKHQKWFNFPTNVEFPQKTWSFFKFYRISSSVMQLQISHQFSGFWRLRNLDIPQEKQWSGRGTAQGPPFSPISPKFMKILHFINSTWKITEKWGKSDFGRILWFPVGSHPSGAYEFALFSNGLGSFWAPGRARGLIFHFSWKFQEVS